MSNDTEAEQDEPIIRRDRYTISVSGHPVRATEDQEARIRNMDSGERARFLKIMGRHA